MPIPVIDQFLQVDFTRNLTTFILWKKNQCPLNWLGLKYLSQSCPQTCLGEYKAVDKCKCFSKANEIRVDDLSK